MAAAAVAVGGVSHRTMMTKIMMLKIMMMKIINPAQSAPAVPRFTGWEASVAAAMGGRSSRSRRRRQPPQQGAPSHRFRLVFAFASRIACAVLTA